MSSLDRLSIVPLYYQLQERLLEAVRSGVLKPGEPVPSEKEISATLRISRMTARQAVKSLCQLGVVYSERGRGTFVSPVKLEKPLRRVLSFTEEMSASGSRPGSKVLSFASAVAHAEIASALRLTPGEKVFCLRRIRLADSTPMGLECSYLPLRLYPDLDRKFDPSGSLYRVLAEVYRVNIHVADEVAEAGSLDASQARLLRATPGAPAFVFTRTSYVKSGEAVEYVKSIYRGDRYKIVSRLTQRKG